MSEHFIVRSYSTEGKEVFLLVPKENHEYHCLLRNMCSIAETVGPFDPSEDMGVFVKDLFSRIYTLGEDETPPDHYYRGGTSLMVTNDEPNKEFYEPFLDLFTRLDGVHPRLLVTPDKKITWLSPTNHDRLGTRIKTGSYDVEEFLPDSGGLSCVNT